jgi:GH25 family lysozyme M1 (1,4-beta-N-acetylmuramidase)
MCGMRTAVSIALLATISILPACVVGEDPEDDAVAGDGLSDGDFNGTDAKGDGIGTLRARVCANGPTTVGIDVSYYQGVIDWSAAKAAGTEFAFIRLSDGARFRDPKFTANWEGAKAAGVIRGAYQFFRPTQDIALQADMMVKAIGRYTPGDLAPVIDVEADGGLAPATVAARVKQWVDLVKTGTGIAPIIYTGKYFWRDEVGGSRAFSDHSLWIAQYTSLCPDLPAPWTRWTFWQHSDRGRMAGIRGNVDMNKFNGTLEQLRAFVNGSADPVVTNRAEALPFYWHPSTSGTTVSFVATPPANVARIEIRVEDYLIGAATPSGGRATLDYTWNAQRANRTVEVRGLDANGATVAVGNGVIDSTTPPKVFINQAGPLEYEFGPESVDGVAFVEVTADGFPLTDSVTGRSKSDRGMVRTAFTQSGERTIKIVTRNAANQVLGTETRTLHVR